MAFDERHCAASIWRSQNDLSYPYCVYVGVLLLLWPGVRRTPLAVSFTIWLESRYLNTDLIQRRSTNAVLLAPIFISRSHKDLSYTYCVYVGVLLLLRHGVCRTPLVVSFEIFLEFLYLNTDLIQWCSSNAVVAAFIFISRSQKDFSYPYCVHVGVLLLLRHGVRRTPLVTGELHSISWILLPNYWLDTTAFDERRSFDIHFHF